MSEPSDRSAVRGARRASLAGCAAILSVTAHTTAGGHLPDLPTTAVLVMLVGWVSTAMADQVHGTTGTVSVLGGAQMVTHVVLSQFSGHTTGGAAMTALHGGATLGTAALLTRVETVLAVAVRVLGTVQELLRAPARPGVRPPCPVSGGPTGVPTGPDTGSRALEVLLHRAHPLRGPPATS